MQPYSIILHRYATKDLNSYSNINTLEIKSMKNYINHIPKRLLFIISFIMIQFSIYAGVAGGVAGGTAGGTAGGVAGGGSMNCSNGTPTNCAPLGAVINAPADPIKKPKAGDELCLATKLKTGLSCTQFTVDTATASTGIDPNCPTCTFNNAKPGCWAGNINRDVWLWFIATSQDMTVSTDAILFNLATTRNQPGYGLYDTQIQIYQSSNDTCTGNVSTYGSAGVGANGCNDDGGINGTNVPIQNYGPPKQAVVELTGLIPGNKYFIRVNAGSNATGGNFCISAFDTYTPGSKPCEAQVVHPRGGACGSKNGNEVINYTSTNNVTTQTDGIQPNAYVPIDPEYLTCAGLQPGQYGTWTRFFDSLYTQETLTNLSGGTRMYSLFSSTTCLHLTCMGTYSLTNGSSATIPAPSKGTQYYILTTLPPDGSAGNPITTQTFTTNLCVQNASATCKALPTAKNLGGVVGAGGNVTGDADNYQDSYRVTQKQVYVTTTYCKNADGAGLCSSQGSNVWFSWAVPSTYPAPGQAFFQMWNKNCTGGPLNGGTDMPVATCAPSNGTCWDFSDPHVTSPGANGHWDWSSNIGWDPNSYSCEYWGVFTGHQSEVCDFNFEVNDSPSLAGVEATQATICYGAGPVQICGKYATGYEWSTGETTTCISVNPTVSTSYTVTATSGADGYDIAYVTVLPLPEATVTGNYTVCQNAAAPTFTLTGKYAGKPPYVFTYNLDGGASQTVTSSGPINFPAGSLQSAVVSYTTSAVGTHTINLLYVQESSSGKCGQAQTGASTILVNPLPTGTVTGTVRKCLNDAPVPKITFTGGNATAPYTFSYKIIGGPAGTLTVTSIAGSSIDSTVTQATGSPGVFTYSLLSVTDNLGCSQTLASSAATSATVTVDNLRAGSLVASPTVVCQNASPAPTVTFTGNGGTPGYIFTYKLGANPTTTLSSGTATNTLLTVPTNNVTSYVYTVSKVTDAGGLTCNSVQTATVTVGPIPTGTVTGTANKCLNDPKPPILFTGTGTAPFIFTYNINGVGAQTVGTTAGSNTVTVLAPTNTAGTYTYNLVSVQDAACSQPQTSSAVVTVNSMGATVASNTTVCQNALPPTITFSGFGGNAPYKFIYTIDASPTQTLTSNGTGTVTGIATTTASTSTPGNSVYTLSGVQDNNGLTCASLSTLTITTNALPTATITGTSNKCLNDPSLPNIIFTGFGTSDPYTFTYSINDGTTTTTYTTVPSASGSSTVAVPAPTNVAGTFTYSLISVKDGTSATCSQNQTGTAVVKINPLQATLAGTTTVCQNSPTLPVITFTGSGGVPPYTFSYTLGGVAQTTVSSPGATSTATITAPTNASGNFVYAVTSIQDANSLSCISTPPSVTITVNKLPTATIAGDANRCLNGSQPVITFTGSVTASPYTFTYSKSDGTTATVTSTTVSALGVNTATIAAPTNVGGTFTYSLISVQDAATCSQNQSGTAVVVVNPLTATVTGNATVCKNDAAPNITFTGSGGTAPYVFVYSINSGSNQTTGQSSPAGLVVFPITTTLNTSYTYSVISVTDANSLNCPSVSGATVKINDLPNATVAGGVPVCQGTATQTVTFTGSNTTAPYTIDYTLNGTAATTVTSLAGTVSLPVSTTVTPGTYAYTLVKVTDASSTACYKAVNGSTTFTINTLPTGTITTTTPDICENVAGLVTFSAFTGTKPFTFNYTRTFNGGASQPATIVAAASSTTVLSIPINSMTPGVYTYNLESITDLNCTTIQNGVGTVTITVHPLPTATVTSTQASICATDVLNVTGATASAGSQISWAASNNAGGFITNGNTETPTYTPIASDAGKTITLTMSVSSLPWCSTPKTASTTVYVYPALVADLSVTPKVCENQPAQLSLNVTTLGTPPYSFKYTENGVQNIPASTVGTNPLAVVGVSTSVTGKIPYLLTEVRDANNCHWNPNVADTMLVLPTPDAVISGGGDACKDSIAPVITFAGTIGTKRFNFTYDINGKDSAIVSTSSNDSIYSLPTSTSKVGTFIYKLKRVTDANGCSKTINGQTITVVVGQNPQAGFKVTPERASILEPTIDISNYSIGAKTFLWHFGDTTGTSVSDNPKNHTYKDTGTYKIRLLTTNGKCKDSTFQIVRVYAPLLLYVPSSFSPNADGINDEFKAEGDGFVKFEMMIFDRWGQLIFESNDINKGWNGKAKGGSDIAQIDSYIYVVNVRAINDKHDYTYRGVVTLIK
jgi:gliding motility-associated-like protein